MDKDEALISAFLNGRLVETPDGRRHHKELDKALERQARIILADLLRNHDRELSRHIRFSLARLFDPDHKRESRKIEIVSRNSGRPRLAAIFTSQIGFDIATAVNEGAKVDNAVEDAMKRYGVSKSTAMRAWKAGKWLLVKPTRRANARQS